MFELQGVSISSSAVVYSLIYCSARSHAFRYLSFNEPDFNEAVSVRFA